MYKFITREEERQGDKTLIRKNEQLFKVVRLRNDYVDNIKTLSLYKIEMSRTDYKSRQIIATRLKEIKTIVSFLNFILDYNRIDIPNSKKRPEVIKEFGKTYSLVANGSIREVFSRLNEIRIYNNTRYSS